MFNKIFLTISSRSISVFRIPYFVRLLEPFQMVFGPFFLFFIYYDCDCDWLCALSDSRRTIFRCLVFLTENIKSSHICVQILVGCESICNRTCRLATPHNGNIFRLVRIFSFHYSPANSFTHTIAHRELDNQLFFLFLFFFSLFLLFVVCCECFFFFTLSLPTEHAHAHGTHIHLVCCRSDVFSSTN